jgi:hypothetical protein
MSLPPSKNFGGKSMKTTDKKEADKNVIAKAQSDAGKIIAAKFSTCAVRG